MPLRHQDPTTGRWNGIDPVTHFSSSTYSGYENNPVFWADPSGACSVCDFFQGLIGRVPNGLVGGGYRWGGNSSVGKIFGKLAFNWARNKALGKVFDGGGTAPKGGGLTPVTTTYFRRYAKSLGIAGNKRVGEFFERLVIKSIQTTNSKIVRNNTNYFSPKRFDLNNGLPKSVRPDAVIPRHGINVRTGKSYVSTQMYEAKATKSTITMGYRKGQIAGMIDVASNAAKDQDSGGYGFLVLITTSNTRISPKIIKYAEDRNVLLYQSVAAMDEETGLFYTSDRELLTGDKTGAWMVNKLMDMLFNWDKFDDVDGIYPIDSINGLPAEPTDPDPPMLDDN